MTRMRATMQNDPDDRGSLALELAVLGPCLLLIISLCGLVGRMSQAQGAAEQAAAQAARAASLARTAPLALNAATTSASTEMAGSHLRCNSVTTAVDTNGFAAAPGTAAVVTVTVSCPVKLSDLLIPGVPGSRTVTATATSPLDTYRARR